MTASSTPQPRARGLRGLLAIASIAVANEVDRVPLGTHHARELHARVQRRSVRFPAARDWSLSLGLGRTRPLAIEVSAPGERYDLPVPARDPWLRAAGAIAALALAATATLAAARWTRGREARNAQHAQKEARRGH